MNKDTVPNRSLVTNNAGNAYSNPETLETYEKEGQYTIPESSLRLIAFYLPQFHPFEENDRFWGRGFTEWTNVTKTLPLYKGHYQPRLPGELGFYDLRVKDILKRQIYLARKYGIHGFCFHHYYFLGKKLMRRPLNTLLEDPDLNFPFCLNWANESWTRRFDGDGTRGELLIEQKHSPADDAAFFRDIEEILKDPRYIKIEGRPVLMVYRIGLFPDPCKTVEIWRKCSHSSGLPELFLIMVQTGFDEITDPAEVGFDAAVEFPPHRVRNISIKDNVELFDPHFNGYICSYPAVAEAAVKKQKPDYLLYRGIFPYWDNTPRIRNSVIYHGSTPALYQQWLEAIMAYTMKNIPVSKQMIFLNAWNEWAEGAYLEPDRKYGYAYLNSTARALINVINN